MTDVRWLPIAGFEGYYEASCGGEIRSLSRVTAYGRQLTGRVLKHMVNTHGYPSVNLYADGCRRTKEVHRLVAEAHMPRITGKPHINHKSGIKADASVGNLEWCTPKENQQHSRHVLRNKGRARQPLIASRQGQEVRFESWMDAASKGFNTGSIHAALNGNHGRKTHGGFSWRYG